VSAGRDSCRSRLASSAPGARLGKHRVARMELAGDGAPPRGGGPVRVKGRREPNRAGVATGTGSGHEARRKLCLARGRAKALPLAERKLRCRERGTARAGLRDQHPPDEGGPRRRKAIRMGDRADPSRGTRGAHLDPDGPVERAQARERGESRDTSPTADDAVATGGKAQALPLRGDGSSEARHRSGGTERKRPCRGSGRSRTQEAR
jgi:hypothetical protein